MMVNVCTKSYINNYIITIFVLYLFVLVLYVYNAILKGRLFGDIFYSTPVNRLFIQDTPIQLLEDDLFFGINHTLSELHIVNSKLTEFPSSPLKVSQWIY